MITRSNIVFFCIIVLWMPRGASVLRVNPRVTAVPDDGITVDDSITTTSEDTASPVVVDDSITTSSEDAASPVVVDDSITTTSEGTSTPVVVDDSTTTSSEETSTPVVVDDSTTTSSEETSTPVFVDDSTTTSSEETATPTDGHSSVTGSSEMHTTHESSFETLPDITVPMSCPQERKFICNNGRCISKEWLCDGEDDCNDGEDEKGCDEVTELQRRERITDCSPDAYHCKGQYQGCIEKQRICNEHEDCPLGDDEENCIMPYCPTYTYQCQGSTKCISQMFLCDRKEDCPGGEDESDCHVCPSGEYKCNETNQCIRDIFVCDGSRDCVKGDDELDCGTINLTRTCTKQANALGFIKGTSVDCYCTEQMSEASAIQVEWEVLDKNQSNGNIAFQISMNSFLHLDVASGAERRLVCFHDGGHTMIHLKFAYIRPKSLTLRMIKEINLCDEIPTYWVFGTTYIRGKGYSNIAYIKCSIKKADVLPVPLFSFSVNDDGFDDPITGIESYDRSSYERVYQFKLSKGGVYNIKCRVINSGYQEIQQEIMKTITVREPPRDPPMLIIKEEVFTGKNEAVLNVTGSDILSPATVACFVNGGFPSATITHRECCTVFDPSQYSSNTTMFRCICRAKHVTGCYSNDESSVTWRNE